MRIVSFKYKKKPALQRKAGFLYKKATQLLQNLGSKGV